MPAVELNNVIMMRSLVERTPVTEIVFVNRNQRRIGFRFYREGDLAAMQLADGATGQILIKPRGSFDADALARALSWTREGTGPNAVYWFDLDLFTDELETAFADNPEKLSNLVLELTIVESGDTITPPAVPCTIWNRYLQADEDLPGSADPDYPASGVILVKTAQTLTGPEKTQVQANLGIDSALIASLFANANFSALPTSDPGNGKPWLNGGVLQVGA